VPTAVAAAAPVAANSAPRRVPRSAAKQTKAAANRRQSPVAKARGPKTAAKPKAKPKVVNRPITRKPADKPMSKSTSAKKSPAAVVRRALKRLA